MRKEYRKAVREVFAEAVRERLPQFERLKVQSPVLFGGESVFRWKVDQALHCFVILVPDPQGRQAFTVELAWSRAARFPEVTSRPTHLLAPDDPDPVDDEEGIVRLGAIAERRDIWWHLPDPALENPGDFRALQQSLEPLSAPVAREDAADPVAVSVNILARSGADFFDALAHRR